MKKVLSIIITITVLLSALTVSIYAINLRLTTSTVTINGRSMLVSNSRLEDAISISSVEAGYIAEMFVADMFGSDSCFWDENTKVVDVVTLYDENGINPTAYSVLLTKGYVIVSAFSDAESLIPEWSYAAEPIYENLNYEDSDTIIYLGSYEYFIDSNSTTVTDLDGNNVNKADLVNLVEASRDIQNMTPALVNSCVVNSSDVLLNSIDNTITDPHAHAQMVYGGTFSTTNYCNQWEDDMYYFTGSDGAAVNSYYANSCGPVAITNIIMSYKKRYPYTVGISSDEKVFIYVAEYGSTHSKYLYGMDCYYYLPYGNAYQGPGTNVVRSPYYILDCLNYYDIPTNVIGNYEATYESIKSHLEEGCLLYMSLTAHNAYQNHAVVCFAYTRMVSSTTGYYKTYLKIADGLNDKPRYIDLSSATCVYDDNGVLINGGWYTKVGLWG